MPSRDLLASGRAPAAHPGNGTFQHQAVAISSSVNHVRGTSSHSLVLGLAIGGGLTALLLCFIIIYYKLNSRRTSSLIAPVSPARLQKFSYRELKSATRSFSSENKLGQGGFGPVYKATLRNGQVVAVKSLDSSSLQGEKEFQNEVSVIGSLRSSSHIVALLGYCTERKKRLLVYEFMAHRSLQEALFHRESFPVELCWKMRYRVILDVARALAFLHSECEPAIVHGDIKPSNVLLDDNMCAKLADFGLARAQVAKSQSGAAGGDVEVNGEIGMEQDKVMRVVDGYRYGRRRRRKNGSRSGGNKTCDDNRAPHSPGGIYEKHGGVGGEEVEEQQCYNKAGGGGGTGAPAGGGGGRVVDQTGPKVVEEEERFSFHNDRSELCESPPTPAARSPPPPQPVAVPSGSELIDDASCWKVEMRQGSDSGVAGVADHGSSSQRVVVNAGEGEKPRWHWWPRHEEDGGTVVKDYTVDWLSCEVKHRQSMSTDWTTDAAGRTSRRDVEAPAPAAAAPRKGGDHESSGTLWPPECFRGLKRKVDHYRHHYHHHHHHHHHHQEHLQQHSGELSGSLTKSREWWREEYLEELTNKSRELKGERCKKKKARSRDNQSWSLDFSGELSTGNNHSKQQWWSGDLLHWIHRSRGDSGFTMDFSGELSRELRNRDRNLSRERWSGELGSRGVSSTTSMRGTVCYTAPEYGGAGVLSEKSDVYSFGVLILVIISGRRPLEVVNPGEMERANLTSWARHLVHGGGDVLELVDTSLLRGEFCEEQARLCIMLALQCIQRIPASRPSMADVVRVLRGECQPPPFVPDLMFSPSPQQKTEQQPVEFPVLNR